MSVTIYHQIWCNLNIYWNTIYAHQGSLECHNIRKTQTYQDLMLGRTDKVEMFWVPEGGWQWLDRDNVVKHAILPNSWRSRRKRPAADSWKFYINSLHRRMINTPTGHISGRGWNAGPENPGPYSRGEKCRTWKMKDRIRKFQSTTDYCDECMNAPRFVLRVTTS